MVQWSSFGNVLLFLFGSMKPPFRTSRRISSWADQTWSLPFLQRTNYSDQLKVPSNLLGSVYSQGLLGRAILSKSCSTTLNTPSRLRRRQCLPNLGREGNLKCSFRLASQHSNIVQSHAVTNTFNMYCLHNVCASKLL